jgi:hypothetical protein
MSASMSIPNASCVKTFRLSILQMTAFYCAAGFTSSLASILVLAGRHPEIHYCWLSFLLRNGLFVAAYSVIISCLFTLFFTCKVTIAGIYGHSLWGCRRFIRWQDMHIVKQFGWRKWGFLRLFSSEGNKVTWIALFLAKPCEFEKECRRLAPENSPILRFLSNQAALTGARSIP